MSESLREIKISGGAQGLEPTVQQLVGFFNGHGANDDDSAFPARPVYNGTGYLLDGNRDTVDGGTLRLRSAGTNHLTLLNTGATSSLPWTLTGGVTLGTLTVTGNATVQGNTTLGNQNSDATTVQGSLTQSGGAWSLSSPTTGTLTTTGNRTDTVGGTFGLTATGAGGLVASSWTITGSATFTSAATIQNALTVTNSAGTLTRLYVDAANGRTLVGTATALTSAADDVFTVVGGVAYFAGNSGPSIGIRYSAAQTVGWTIGASAAGANPDLVFKDDAGTEVFRTGDASATYQADVTGDLHVSDDAVIAGLASAGKGVFGATAMAGTEELRVVGQTRLEGDTTVTTGTVTVSAGNIDVQGGTAGEIRVGKVIVGAASLSGTEELRVVGQTRLEGDVAVTAGALTVPATDPPTANTEVTAGSVAKAWAHFTVSGGAITFRDSYNVDTAASTYNAAGDYSIVWDRNFASAYYAVVVTVEDNGGVLLAPKVNGQIAGSADIWVYNATATKTNPDAVSVVCFGTLS